MRVIRAGSGLFGPLLGGLVGQKGISRPSWAKPGSQSMPMVPGAFPVTPCATPSETFFVCLSNKKGSHLKMWRLRIRWTAWEGSGDHWDRGSAVSVPRSRHFWPALGRWVHRSLATTVHTYATSTDTTAPSFPLCVRSCSFSTGLSLQKGRNGLIRAARSQRNEM